MVCGALLCSAKGRRRFSAFYLSLINLKPQPRFRILHPPDQPKNILQRVNQNPELIPRFENLLEEWCNQIEEYLNPRER